MNGLMLIKITHYIKLNLLTLNAYYDNLTKEEYKILSGHLHK